MLQMQKLEFNLLLHLPLCRYFGVIVPLVSVMLCHKKKDDFLAKFIN